MKINFNKNINGFQEARKLRLILEHYAHSDIADKTTQLFIQSLLEELDIFLTQPEFMKFNHSAKPDSSFFDAQTPDNKFISIFVNMWRTLSGPSKRELLLSKQRQELLERAERAEIMAFDAIAETAEVGRERDSTLKKIKELEDKRSM